MSYYSEHQGRACLELKKCDGQITYSKCVDASKCKYFQSELEFQGHVITPSGICPTPQRIVDVCKAPVSTNKSKLKSFLGLMTYNGKFISSVASLLHPLYQLLWKDLHWKWTAKCQEAFDSAKTLVSKAPVLVHYDVTKPIKLYCDASAVGACIIHVVNGEEKPVAYASRALSVAEQNYAHIKHEALAIVLDVKCCSTCMSVNLSWQQITTPFTNCLAMQIVSTH